MNKGQTNSFQHYVPRFLLEYFTDDGLLWVYDRKLNQYRQQPSKATAGEKAYYVFTGKDKKKKDALEGMFSVIEGVAATVIKDLVAGKRILDAQEKADMATFLSALYLRVPDSLRKTEEMSTKMTKEVMSKIARFYKHFQKTMDEIEKKHGTKITQKEREDIQNTFTDKKYDLRFPKGHMLGVMMKMFQEFYFIMAQMGWVILETPKNKEFVGSDHPALTFNVRPEGFWGSGIGILAPNCETTAVLTPKLCIFMSQKHNPDSVEFAKASSGQVDNINFRTTVCSSRFLISHNQGLLKKWVEKTQLHKRGLYSAVNVG